MSRWDTRITVPPGMLGILVWLAATVTLFSMFSGSGRWHPPPYHSGKDLINAGIPTGWLAGAFAAGLVWLAAALRWRQSAGRATRWATLLGWLGPPAGAILVTIGMLIVDTLRRW